MLPGGEGATPLGLAAQKGHTKTCAVLLDHGATHAGNPTGVTPLQVVAHAGHAEVCALLLDRGTNSWIRMVPSHCGLPHGMAAGRSVRCC